MEKGAKVKDLIVLSCTGFNGCVVILHGINGGVFILHGIKWVCLLLFIIWERRFNAGVWLVGWHDKGEGGRA